MTALKLAPSIAARTSAILAFVIDPQSRGVRTVAGARDQAS
jgi:hypothetical protein